MDKSAGLLLEVVSPLIDERAGVIGQVHPLPLPRTYNSFMYGFAASVGRVEALHPTRIALMSGQAVTGYGTALEEPVARIRAVCEALERYCALMHPTDGIMRATPRELGTGALDVRRLPRCSVEERRRAAPENRLHHPGPDEPIDWIRGYSLTERRPVMVPLTAIYLGLPLPLTKHVTFPMSTGFAAGSSYNQAVLAALCEVVERDSLALWWLHQLPFPKVEIDTVELSSLHNLLERQRDMAVQTTLFDLTTDVGIPVIGIVQTSERHRPHVITMAACRTQVAKAAQRVIEEAESLRIALSRAAAPVDREGVLRGDPHPAESFGLLYSSPEGPARFSFALCAGTRSGLPRDWTDPDPLEALVDRLRTLGMEVIVVDVTLPEVHDFGIVVVRVLVPELMTLTFSHSIRYLAHPRLASAPEKLGFGSRTEATITPDPIPYA